MGIFTTSNILLFPLFTHILLCESSIPFFAGSIASLCLCSVLDDLPLLVSFRRLPHLDAPVMVTTSVSNINVSVQLGDTTPFALGFLSACGGTWLLYIPVHAQTDKNGQVYIIYSYSFAI